MTVVYLHAFPLDERMWPMGTHPPGPMGTHAPRLYGRGRSMDEWAESVLEEFPGRLVLVGASMGGYCALAAARLAPERLAGLVLAGSRPDADSPAARERRAETLALAHKRGAEGIWRSMREALFPPDADPDLLEQVAKIALERTEDELVAGVEAMRDRPDSTAAYRALGDRRLTIVGDRDPFVPVEDARGFDPAAVVLDGCGHLPSLERPDEFGRHVEQAVERWT